MKNSLYEALGLTDEQQLIAQRYLQLRPTAELKRVSQEKQQWFAVLPVSVYGSGPSERRTWAERDVEKAEQELSFGIERDALQAARPEACWCLGIGGRRPTWENVGEQRWHFLEEHCVCPEGSDRQVKDLEQRRAIQTAQGRQRALKFRCSLPVHFQGLMLKTYPITTAEQQSIVDYLRAWMDPEVEDCASKWLLLHGPYGTGKTGLAGALGAELLECGVVQSVQMVAVPALLDRIRATYDRTDRADETEADVFDKLRDIECLILDDLGAERSTDWATEKLFTLINHRHDHENPTIITSNLNPAELGAHIGERTMWRIAELAAVVSLEGCPNLRLPGTRKTAPRNVVPITRRGPAKGLDGVPKGQRLSA